MTPEQKELLLKDLSARLPYNIKASYYGKEEECETWDEIEGITLDGYVNIGQYSLPIENIKPYLYPLSNMTKEQNLEYKKLCERYCSAPIYSMEMIDWLNKHYFDYRGLINKSFALDATNLNIY